MIIFCGHFPEGVEEFSEEEVENETRGGWYMRQMLGSANLTGGKLFHILQRQPLAPDRAPRVPRHPGAPLRRDRRRGPEICERYGLPYNAGPLGKQFGSVVKKICRLALPGSVTPRSTAALRRPSRHPSRPPRVAHADDVLANKASKQETLVAA